MKEEIICKRCSRCCHYMLDGKLKKCKHLIWITDNKTYCRIFKQKNRVGTIIDRSKSGKIIIRCNNRKDVPLNYKDCPYNIDGQPNFDDVYLG